MLLTRFQFIWQTSFRGEDLNKSANQKQELPMAAMFVNGSGQNEHSLERTFHRYFLPSFTSFGWGISEEKIKMWKVNGRWMPSDGKSSHCLWQGEVKIQIKPIWLNHISCSPWLMSWVWEIWRNLIMDPMSWIFNNIKKNMGYGLSRPIRLLIANNSSLVLNYITFIVLEVPFLFNGKGHNIWFLQISNSEKCQ
jgi:hypothetical protein